MGHGSMAGEVFGGGQFLGLLHVGAGLAELGLHTADESRYSLLLGVAS